MKAQTALVALTAVNLALLGYNLVETRQAHAAASGVLRGTGLQIVDSQGHVRASIEVLPADPNVKMPDGSRGYPETTLLRLMDEKGRPNVKVFASDQGGGFGAGGGRDPTYARLMASGPNAEVWLRDEQGRERTMTPIEQVKAR
jgi:hypothetical protein